MLTTFLIKTWPIWINVSIAVWAIIFRETLIKLFKETFGGFFGRPPKDENKPKEDK
jgi:hypothetical protein